MEKLGDSDNYALNITSISSYTETIEVVRIRYNRDEEDLEQINLALFIGSRSRLPAYYSFISNNVNDKTLIKKFIHIVKVQKFIGFSIVTDKGFYFEENINEL